MNTTLPIAASNPTTEYPGARILVVDDAPQNLTLMSELLRPLYHVSVANRGDRALHLMGHGELPDLILLDIMMPHMDGYEVLRQVRANPRTRDIPVIFLTAKSEIEDEALGLALGAQDYITKPICAPIVLARIEAQLKLKGAADFLRDKAVYLAAEVERRTARLETIQDITVLVMSSMAETRDNETGNHILRTQHYVKCLAQALAQDTRFAPALKPDIVQQLFKSAPLHDIGKVGIPDHILLKPGKLTPSEFEIMKAHTTIGYESIVRAERLLGAEVDFLRLAKEISLSHQEKWDGSGYPQGLAGEAIPLSARLMAVADVYDALISRRVYKEAFSHEKAVSIMQDGRGTHFDPVILDVFLQIQDQFQAIAARWSDH